MSNNYCSWGERRKVDIAADEKIADKEGECRKLDERLAKFSDKCAFHEVLKAMPNRKQVLASHPDNE